MKDLPRIASMLYCEPWAILPEVHGQMCDQFHSYLERGGGVSADAEDPVGPSFVDYYGNRHYRHPQVEVSGGVALI